MNSMTGTPRVVVPSDRIVRVELLPRDRDCGRCSRRCRSGTGHLARTTRVFRHRSERSNPSRLFGLEVRVADLEREVPDAAEEVQLLERRVARRARETDGERELVCAAAGRKQHTDGSRDVREVAVAQARPPGRYDRVIQPPPN